MYSGIPRRCRLTALSISRDQLFLSLIPNQGVLKSSARADLAVTVPAAESAGAMALGPVEQAWAPDLD